VRIHNTEIDPTTITRLRIVHAHGELDLGGAHAVAAMQAIRRVAPRGGKVGRPDTARAAIRVALADGQSLTVSALAALTGLSRSRIGCVVPEMVEAGELAEGEPRSQARGAPMKTYHLASADI
jgi:hypothetical protein